ncbi:MAG: copper-binding protein [Candidatus Krumholzibacteriia bacterium]
MTRYEAMSAHGRNAGRNVWTRARAVAVIAGVVLPLALILAACGGEGEDDRATMQADAHDTGDARVTDHGDGPMTEVYTVRGIVERLPEEGGDRSVYIRHQAIPEYRDDTGEVVGMDSMTMPFPVADSVSLDGLEPGDPVEFTFEVSYQPSRYEITAIEELPAGTEVRFERAQEQ